MELITEPLSNTIKVYNFEVEDWHTYYVSNSEVLVHNTGTNPCAMAGKGEIKNTYNSIKQAPKYPKEFKAAQNGTKKVSINNSDVLNELRQVEAGQWKKV